MALHDTTRTTCTLPKLCLVYFKSVKTTSIVEAKKLKNKETTSIVEAKKLKNKETGEALCGKKPERGTDVIIRCGCKTYEARIIALDGKE